MMAVKRNCDGIIISYMYMYRYTMLVREWQTCTHIRTHTYRPLLPALAVLPTRWMYCFIVCGMFILITVLIRSISSPRAARSVANKKLALPSWNRLSDSSRYIDTNKRTQKQISALFLKGTSILIHNISKGLRKSIHQNSKHLKWIK